MQLRIIRSFRPGQIKFVLLWSIIIMGLYSIYNDLIREVLLKLHETKKPETMHLVGVSCSRPNFQGKRDLQKPMDLTLTMVKSAALFAQSPLHIHIFTEDDMMNLFQMEFEAWPKTILSRVKHSLYPINYDKYLSHPMATIWKKWYKPCGSYRLLAPMILQNVTSAAIYSDSDVIFLKPIDQLWATMKQFKQREAVAISPTSDHPLGGSKYNENFIPHSTGLFQINSGILVMNFTRMLNSDWLIFYDEKATKSNKSVPRRKYGMDLLLAYYSQFKASAEHDQKLLNLIFHYNPDLIKQLSCSWNFKNNFCQDESNVCRDAEAGDGAGAVHGITSVFFGDGNPTFRALYEAFLKYDFEEDIEAKLLQPFLHELKNSAKDSFCWRKSHIIIKPLKDTIQNLDKTP